jgi:choline dehydrogenase-like flavoprotein
MADVIPDAGTELYPGREVSAREHVEANVRGFFHPVGTCAIGRVVDGEGRVPGVDGLCVADASVMPTIPRANTNLSTLALAERLAERI